jgi:hypothetical protein
VINVSEEAETLVSGLHDRINAATVGVAWADVIAIVSGLVARVKAAENQGNCTYREEEGSEFWQTDCGRAFVWEDGPPSQHGCIYCGHCGKPIVEKPFMEPVEKDGDEEAAEGNR